MSYADAIEFLYSLRLFGAKFGLENTLQLAASVGHPEKKLRFIHVAGTNGKGSTCAMLESIYRAAGLRTGMFTSPHLVSFAERIQVNRRWIAEPDVVRLVEDLRARIAGLSFSHGQGPTFFEFITVMALMYFAEQNCELVLWETGLGGRLDATNIVTPLASVITNIGIEHSEWLGDTYEKIAAEKAGIIKPGVPLVTAAEPGKGLEVIAAAARERRAPLTVVDSTSANHSLLKNIDLPLHGPHQRINAATALATAGVLQGHIRVGNSALSRGLGSVRWRGRMERVQKSPGQIMLLDGAHNPAGAQALAVALEAEFPGARPTLIFGVFRDKDSVSMCRSLVSAAGRVVLTRVQSDRSEDPEKLARACREVNPRVPIQVCESLERALENVAGDPLVVIAGSLYLVGEAMELLQLMPAPAEDEKGLNQWRAWTK